MDDYPYATRPREHEPLDDGPPPGRPLGCLLVFWHQWEYKNRNERRCSACGWEQIHEGNFYNEEGSWSGRVRWDE